MADDLGGPRKEFFRLVLTEIKEIFFDKGLRDLQREKYVAVGILLGESVNMKMYLSCVFFWHLTLS